MTPCENFIPVCITTSTLTHAHTHTNTHTHIHARTCTRAHVYLLACTQVYARTNMRTHARTHSQTKTQIHVHIHIQMHTRTCLHTDMNVTQVRVSFCMQKRYLGYLRRLAFLSAGEPVPKGRFVAAQASYVDSSVTKSNFGKLRIEANDESIEPLLRYRAAGFAEGYLSAGDERCEAWARISHVTLSVHVTVTRCAIKEFKVLNSLSVAISVVAS